MATLYYNGAVNTDWNELGNWWDDSGHTVPATSLPTSSDSVVSSAEILSNSGSTPTVVNFTQNNGNLSIAIIVTDVATFNAGSMVDGNITGNCVFNNDSISRGTITGNATFTASSYTGLSSNAFTGNGVSGTITFSSATPVSFTLSNSNTWFVNTSALTFTTPDPTWTFNGDSYLESSYTIEGDCTFNSTSKNTGTIVGDCTFNGTSYNDGNVTGDATFNNSSYNIGTVTGTTTYNGFTGWNSDLSIYFVGGEETVLDSSGNGFWSGKAYYGGIEQATGYNGYFYYINNVETTLNSNGDGCWNSVVYSGGITLAEANYTGVDNVFNGGCGGNVYWISGVETTLDSSGSGFYDGQAYFNGSVQATGWNGFYYYINNVQTSLGENSGGTGYDSNTSTYYISNTATALDSNGSGFYDGQAYYNGSVQATGWNGFYYYINNVETTLNSSGNGTWDGYVYYNGCNTNIANPGRGYDNTCGSTTYYIDGASTTLNSSGDGNWNGTDYVNGLSARTLYYNAAVDTDWNNLGNWWNNSSHTVQAISLPSSIDSVITSAGIESNSGSTPTVVNFTQNSGTGYVNLGISTTVTGVATFNFGTMSGGTVTGNCVFNNDAKNFGTIVGNAIFTASSYSGTSSNAFVGSGVSGTITFSSLTPVTFTLPNSTTWFVNTSALIFTAPNPTWIFNGDSRLESVYTISGNCTFNETSRNTGTIVGNCIFNDSSYNDGGSISGEAKFSLSSASVMIENSYTGTYGSIAFKYEQGINGSSILGLI
jgi:hypothetical protein